MQFYAIDCPRFVVNLPVGKEIPHLSAEMTGVLRHGLLLCYPARRNKSRSLCCLFWQNLAPNTEDSQAFIAQSGDTADVLRAGHGLLLYREE